MNFGLNQPFRLEPAILAVSLVSADTARVGANQRESGQVSVTSVRVGEEKKTLNIRYGTYEGNFPSTIFF